MRERSEIAKDTAKQCVSAYNIVTKHIRPTGFFLTTGAIVGGAVAIAKDIMKKEAVR